MREEINRVRMLLGAVESFVPDHAIENALRRFSPSLPRTIFDWHLCRGNMSKEKPKPNLSWPEGYDAHTHAVALLDRLFGRTDHAPVTVYIVENYIREELYGESRTIPFPGGSRLGCAEFGLWPW